MFGKGGRILQDQIDHIGHYGSELGINLTSLVKD
jgi:hypothetical protein